jgi:hypothetical protein
MRYVADDIEQIGKPIGRITRNSEVVTIVSGTTQSTDILDFRNCAGAIVETPIGHTGTLYFQECDNYGGLSMGRLADDTATDYEITQPVGGRSYTAPAGIYPAHFMTLELSAAAPETLEYKIRFKG